MRIGVICEGPTDFHAIEGFLGAALSASGIAAEFESIQPNLDQTLPNAGWGNVFLWLDRFPPAYRIQNYFGGGLFGGQLARDKLDCLIIQLDSDILGEQSFCKHVLDKYQYTAQSPTETTERAAEIRRILAISSRFSEMTEADVSRHVLAPAVESTEAWCVAAFRTPTENFELLTKEELINEFMSCLEISESRELMQYYSNIDKDQFRRKKFCDKHKVGWLRVAEGCQQFKTILGDILSLAPTTE